ncbi:MAG TPA: archaeosine biosynthesis radical SAM protein RaSEA [Thermoplasmata archaeon]|nr:archaeosine biosynthesis radical SAM protein RaSEA [Thermoplasmata archaeon]
MESVARTVARDRRPTPGGPESADRYVNLWTEAESIGTERIPAFVLILRTRGCYWADVKGCSMCGYAKDTLGRSATPEELARQVERALARYRDEPYVKIYTSGSFLDDREVDPSSRVAVVRSFAGRARRLLIETLPEFATGDNIGPLREAFAGDLEVALGLESTQEPVLRRLINKNAPPSQYLEAADRLRTLGAHPKAYLLLKPPYLTERESVEDLVESVRVAHGRFETISVNPVHIQNGTVVEWLFRRHRYRPPWLWSLVEAMRRGAELRGAARLVTFPTAGGRPRGPHNCGRCDARVLAALEAASLDQRFEGLDGLSCECRAVWERSGAMEALGVEA